MNSPANHTLDPIRPIVIGTAGHVDHGKSTLVRTLTGIDPDRLKEEKARGLNLEPKDVDRLIREYRKEKANA